MFNKLTKLSENLTNLLSRFATLENITTHTHDIVSQSIDQRLKTVEWVSNQARLESRYTNELLEKIYKELIDKQNLSHDDYFSRAKEFGENINLATEHPVAYGADSIEPESTYEGTMRPTRFVRDCIEKLGGDIQCLDIGAGPGGLVYEWIFNGIKAIGIDGSDFCQRYHIGFWDNMRSNMFTCDVTKPFNMFTKDSDKNILFNVITMWEVLEHIPEEGLENLFKNIRRHLHSNGYVLGSISLLPYSSASGVPYHITLQPKEWWKEKMDNFGLEMTDEHPFNINMFCRGVGNHIQDQHNYFQNPNAGFHFVARLKTNG